MNENTYRNEFIMNWKYKAGVKPFCKPVRPSFLATVMKAFKMPL